MQANASMRTAPPESTFVEIALRCFPVLIDQKKRRRRRARSTKPPAYVFVFDTETEPDVTQQLTFGSYRGYQLCSEAEPHTYDCFEEGLFYADDAPAEAIERLRIYARAHKAETSVRGRANLLVRSQTEQLQVFYDAAVRTRALVAGMNLAFDLSRLARDVGEGRKGAKGGFSFTLWTYRKPGMKAAAEHRYRPRLTIKTIDSKRSLKQFTRAVDQEEPDSENGHPFRGNLLELRTLAFALTDQAHSLDSACKAFGVERKGNPGRHPGWAFDDEYIDYNRRDTRITGELLFAMLREYARHPIAIAPVDVYSPASIGKGYLEAMGVSPPLERWDFPKTELGYAMSTFYGGRASARIRRFLVPVRYCDFLSMYPTVNALLGTWELLTAQNYKIVDVTERAQSLLDSLTLNALFAPEIWPQLGFFARLTPTDDILPVRTRWEAGDARQIGINPLRSSEPLWFAGPDLAASVLLSGKRPRVLRAFAIEPVRTRRGKPIRKRGLRNVRLLGSVDVDPRHDDFFVKLIKERQRARRDLSIDEAERARRDKGLKVIANASSYGILAQMDPVGIRVGETAEVEVFGAVKSFHTRTSKPEKPGAYFFPPIAALITAGARCMLAMLERCVADLGGAYAMEDTDSMAIVATPAGGRVPCPGGPHAWTPKEAHSYRGPNIRGCHDAVRALSFDEIDSIVKRFAKLNPYDQSTAAGSILKVEDVNFDEHRNPRQLWCYAISSKRYSLFTLDDNGAPHVARTQKPDGSEEWHCSEHGLGHLLNPVDAESEDRAWIVQAWETILREHLGLPAAEPGWLDRPALTRLAISTPHLFRPFAKTNEGKPYAARIKPFNFLLAAHIAPLGFPTDANASRFLLIAPFESDPKRWDKLSWIDVHSGTNFAVTTDRERHIYDARTALMQTYRGVLAAFRLHPEAKSARPDGLPCDELHKDYAGLLSRRPAIAVPGTIDHIGKEMNELDDVLGNVVHDEDQIITRYVDPSTTSFDKFRVLLRAIPKRALVELSSLSERTIERARRGVLTPHPRNQARFLQAIIAYFSDHPPPTFEIIEQLDPDGVATEIRARVKEVASREAARTSVAELQRAREEVRAAYTERLRASTELLGL